MTLLLGVTLFALGTLSGFVVRFLLDRVTGDPVTVPDLTARLDALEQAEATREAATLDALDKFDRLYKRMVARTTRQDAPESTNATGIGSEPDLTFRDRVRAQRGF